MRKESTTIKSSGFISTLALCAALIALCVALLTSCSSEGDLQNGDINNNDATTSLRGEGVLVDAHDKIMDGNDTRSSLSYDRSRGMVFQWTADDQLTVFAKDNYSNRMTYALKSGSGGTQATFTSNNFALTADGTRYFALSKSEATAGGSTSIPDLRNIVLDYDGQTQTSNANPSHLGRYDYMAASTICTDEQQAHFSFTHLGLTLRLWMWPENSADYADFANAKFTKLEIYDSENSFKKPQRDFSFEAGMSGDTYSPVWPAQTYSPGDERFSVALNDIRPTDPFADNAYNNTDPSGNIVVYVELPPADLTGKTMGFTLSGFKQATPGEGEYNQPVTFYCTYRGFNMEGDKAYRLNMTLLKPTKHEVTLKINHRWQHGDKEPDSRAATGDPGYDKEYGLPAHVYYIFCVDGHVRNVKHQEDKDASELPYNHFATSTVEGVDWTTKISDNGATIISTLREDTHKLVLSVPQDQAALPQHLYVIASKEEIPEAKFTAVTGGASEEDVVRTLTYDMAGDYQIFMRDLYSTPWDATNFVGNLTDPVQDVTLYHTAAKVDLKWNSTTEMTPGSGVDVKVNNVKSTGLYMFQPTANTNTAGTYTPSTPITWGTCYNGRQVYYLPQFSDNRYNVTIGGRTYTPYTFEGVSTEGGFTSWYRALIRQ